MSRKPDAQHVGLGIRDSLHTGVRPTARCPKRIASITTMGGFAHNAKYIFDAVDTRRAESNGLDAT